MYTIGQVSEMFGLPASTLRYYDKQGLFPALERTSGIRQFGDTELEALRMPQESGDGDQGHPSIHGMVRGGSIDIPQTQGHVRGAEGPHGARDREHEPRAGHAEVQMLVLRAAESGRE